MGDELVKQFSSVSAYVPDISVERRQVLEEEHEYGNVNSQCVLIGDIIADQEGSDIHAGITYSPDQQYLIEQYGRLESFGSLGQTPKQYDAHEDAIFCTGEQKRDSPGYIDSDINLVFIENSSDTLFLSSHLLEEFGHSLQYYTDHNLTDVIKNKDLSPIDHVIFRLGVEAQAKVSIAYEAVHQMWNEDNPELFEDLQQENQNILDEIPDERKASFKGYITFNMAEFLNESIVENGIDALNNPDVLSSAFQMFYQHQRSVDYYSNHYLPNDWQQMGDDTIPYDQFSETFGHILGHVDATQGFMSDRFEKTEDMVGVIREAMPRAEGHAILLMMQIERASSPEEMDRLMGLDL